MSMLLKHKCRWHCSTAPPPVDLTAADRAASGRRRGCLTVAAISHEGESTSSSGGSGGIAKAAAAAKRAAAKAETAAASAAAAAEEARQQADLALAMASRAQRMASGLHGHAPTSAAAPAAAAAAAAAAEGPAAGAAALPSPHWDVAAVRAAIFRVNATPLWAAAGPEPSDEQLAAFQEQLGYHFSQPALLRVAFRHSSACPPASNAMLAWLGDAALYLLFAEEIAAALGSPSGIGPATEARKAAISRQRCAELGRALGIPELLTLGKSITVQLEGGASDNMVAEAFEAVLGAVHVDGGGSLEAVRSIYRRHFPLPPLEALGPELQH